MGETEQKQRTLDTGTVVLLLLFAICVVLFVLSCGDKLLGLPKLLFVFLRMASIVGLILHRRSDTQVDLRPLPFSLQALGLGAEWKDL